MEHEVNSKWTHSQHHQARGIGFLGDFTDFKHSTILPCDRKDWRSRAKAQFASCVTSNSESAFQTGISFAHRSVAHRLCHHPPSPSVDNSEWSLIIYKCFAYSVPGMANGWLVQFIRFYLQAIRWKATIVTGVVNANWRKKRVRRQSRSINRRQKKISTCIIAFSLFLSAIVE